MNKLLHENKDFKYYMTDTFDSKMLLPVIRNHCHRPENEWDDWNEYNQVYCCLHFIETVRDTTNIKLDFHYIHKGKRIVGLGIIIHGEINPVSHIYRIVQLTEDNEHIMLFNCLYTSPEGREVEGYWLKNIILPLYREFG